MGDVWKTYIESLERKLLVARNLRDNNQAVELLEAELRRARGAESVRKVRRFIRDRHGNLFAQ